MSRVSVQALAIVALLIWVIAPLSILVNFGADEGGKIGDAFGAVTSLFSALTVLFALFTIRSQQQLAHEDARLAADTARMQVLPLLIQMHERYLEDLKITPTGGTSIERNAKFRERVSQEIPQFEERIRQMRATHARGPQPGQVWLEPDGLLREADKLEKSVRELNIALEHISKLDRYLLDLSKVYDRLDQSSSPLSSHPTAT